MQVVPTLRTLHTCRYDGSWSCGKCGATHPVDQRCPLGVNPPCRSVDVWLPLVAAGPALLSCMHLPSPVQIAACSNAPQPQPGLACRRADPFPGLPHTPDLAMVPQTLLSPLAHLVVSPLTLPTSSIHPGRRSYLIGRCQTGVGCGVAHPPIELDSDAFPADLPWQEVAVVPPGALQGRSAAQWRALLRRHTAAAPAPRITSQLGHLVHCSGGVDAADEQPSARSKLRGQGGPAPPNPRAKGVVAAATSADRLAVQQQAERRARSAQRAAADVAAAAQAMLQGRPRDPPGQAKEFRSKVIW